MSRMHWSNKCGWMASMVLGLCLAMTGCMASRPAPELTVPSPEVFIPATTVAPDVQVIAGRVLWGDAPVAGARVEMRTGAWADPQASQVVAQTVADAEGEYALEVPPDGDDFGLAALWPDGGANPAPVTPVRITPDAGRIEADVALARELVWLEPASGAEVSTTPTVRWGGLPDVDHYQLWVVDQGTTELVFDLNIAENTASEQRVLLPPLTPGRRWRSAGPAHR